MNKINAIEIVGGLSSPSKLPCYSYSIPASKCITGNKLRKVSGSICSKCYAHKGFYTAYPVVQIALERRYNKLNDSQWIEAMTFLINNVEKSGFFRWHDSGDLQSVKHLSNIVEVCKNTPTVKHWLPTREYRIVADYLLNNTFPDNLIVRLSTFMLEGKPPATLAKKLGVFTSGASKDNYNCLAPKQNNKCVDCRLCWDKSVDNIIYHTH